MGEKDTNVQEAKKYANSAYKGFAYMKNSDRPKVIFGNSKEKMIKMLQEWNKTRTEGFTYDTCSIGSRETAGEKYGNYERFDVRTGRKLEGGRPGMKEEEAARLKAEGIRLNLPQGLSREAFRDTIQYFKENGARFLPEEKAWVIREEQKGAFTEYLEEQAERGPAPLSFLEEAKKSESIYPKPSAEYTIKLTNGEQIHLTEEEILKISGVDSRDKLTAGNVVDSIEKTIESHMQRTETSTVQKDQNREPAAKELEPGEKVKLYVPEYRNMNGFQEICGIKEVSGIIEVVDLDTYKIRNLQGELEEVKKTEVYDERQAAVMERAVGKEIPPEQLDLIGQPSLSAAQMEQVLNGLQDGLSPYQAAMYANPGIAAWQMDIYRYGMGNGLSFYDLKDIVERQAGNPAGWEESRNLTDKMIQAQRNLIIKDLKANKITPEKRLVGKFEKLNGLTGKMNTVKGIMQSLKQGQPMGSDTGKIMKEIGKEVSRQMQLAKRPPSMQAPVR